MLKNCEGVFKNGKMALLRVECVSKSELLVEQGFSGWAWFRTGFGLRFSKTFRAQTGPRILKRKIVKESLIPMSSD